MSELQDRAAQATRELIALISATPGGRCLLVIDPILRPIETEQDGEQGEADPWQHYARLPHTPVPIAHSGVDPLHCPQLTPLRLDRDTDRALLVHSVQEACAELAPEQLHGGQGRRIGGWIVTDAPVDDVAAHLGQIMLQRQPSGRTVWLRLQDPAVLWVLSGWLQPPQLAALLGPVGVGGSFNLLTPAGQLLSLRAEGAAGANGMDLSAAQWAAIDCIEPLNAALRDWPGGSPEQLRTARSNAFAAIRRAKAMGFDDPIDLALYGRYALGVHARFDFHALVSSRLRGRVPGDRFGALVADLGLQDWGRIAREGPPPEAQAS